VTCRERLDELKGTIESLRAVTAPLPPPDLFARVVLSAEAEPSALQHLRVRLSRLASRLTDPFPGGLRLADLTGLALVLLLIVGVSGLSMANLSPWNDLPKLVPNDDNLVRFRRGAHYRYGGPALTVVATVRETGDALVQSIVTPGELYVSRRRVSTGPADRVVVLVFQTIFVTG
jgi:hypothetical protein